jgi:hypothetical protein
MPRVVLAPRWMWWRARAIDACDDALVIERRTGDERIAWADVDAVIDLAPVLIESRGRVIARLPDDDSTDLLIAAIVERAGLEWVERSRKVPRMAVRPAVAASLRSGQPRAK